MVDQLQQIGKQPWPNPTETPNNSTNDTTMPLDMTFNEGHVLSIVAYSVLMAVAAIGNITVLVLLMRRKQNVRSRINTMVMHLAIADLMVTFLLMPLEIGWASTVSWKAGDAMCRIMAFFRTFGLYLSSFVLICISVDRYYAVLKPLSLSSMDRRSRLMLTAAWAASTLCSMPQMFIFHVQRHPTHRHYEQCVIYGVLNEPWETAYKYFGMVMMYALPLVVILYCYYSIISEIYNKVRDCQDERIRFRRSTSGFLGRAKIRTLKMTIIIVLVFIICWTPYYFICLWYWIDVRSASEVNPIIQKGLFLFAVANSCMNPIVYGAFHIRAKGTIQRGPPVAIACNKAIGNKVVCDTISLRQISSWKKGTNTPSTIPRKVLRKIQERKITTDPESRESQVRNRIEKVVSISSGVT